MRKALNENPLVQIALIGALAIAVAVLFIMRMGGGGGEAAATPEPSATVPATSAAAATGTSAGASSATPTSAGGATPAATPAAASVPANAPGFEPGPGLPRAVVGAYRRGDAIALLVTEKKGIEDKPVRRAVEQLRSRKGVAVFMTTVRHIADYSRIARGVDLNRAPALVIIRPRKLSGGELPAATISYGYRGPDSVRQALRDAFYKGKRLPYHPG